MRRRRRPGAVLEIGCDDARRALAALEGLAAVGSSEWLGDAAVRVTLAASSDASGVVHALVLAVSASIASSRRARRSRNDSSP